MTTKEFSRYDKGYLNVHFNLKQSKDSLKLTQIFLSTIVQGRRIRVYSRLRIEPEYWDRCKNRCIVDDLMSKRVLNRMRMINTRLDDIERQIGRADRLVAEKGLYLSSENIKKIVYSLPEEATKGQKDTLQIMKQIAAGYDSRLNENGRVGQKSTTRTYLAAIGRLETYVSDTARKPLSFNDFNRKFMDDFADYLTRNTFESCGARKQYTANTIACTIAVIHNILKKAYRMELSDNPCDNLVEGLATAGTADKIYLTEKELTRLAKVPVRTATERDVRDMFIMASYTGLRISDLNHLNEASFVGGQIVVSQTKTKDVVHIPILKEVAALIGSYRQTQFPVLGITRANACIKELACRAGIVGPVTISENRGGIRRSHSVPKYTQVSFHTARRSCITNLFKRGYSANYIMSLSGHRSIASFQRYIKSNAEEMSQAFITELRKRKDVL